MSASVEQVGRMLKEADDLLADGKHHQAIEGYRRALGESERSFGESSEEVIRPLIALSHAMAGRSPELAAEVLEITQRAREVALRSFGEEDVRTSRVLYNLSFGLQKVGRDEEAVKDLFDALRIASRALEAEDELWILRALTNSLLLGARHLEALPHCKRLLLLEEARGPDRSATMVAEYQLGLCLLRLGQSQSAILHLERAREIRMQRVPGLASDKMLEELEELLAEASRADE